MGRLWAKEDAPQWGPRAGVTQTSSDACSVHNRTSTPHSKEKWLPGLTHKTVSL